MKVICVPVFGEMEENCFFYIDEITGHGWVIDPGAEPQRLLSMIEENHWMIEGILLTHGHFDHIGAALPVAEALRIPIYANKKASAFLEDPSMNLSAYYGEPIVITKTTPVSEGMEITLPAPSSATLCVIETPGHTPDSVLYYDKEANLAFVGDTIFKGSYGNYRLPGGDGKALFDSLIHKVLRLPGETQLYSGHTDVTTVKEERPHYEE